MDVCYLIYQMVAKTGLEPACFSGHHFLKVGCLPIPPLRHLMFNKEGIEPLASDAQLTNVVMQIELLRPIDFHYLIYQMVAAVGNAPTFQAFQTCTNLSQLSSHSWRSREDSNLHPSRS